MKWRDLKNLTPEERKEMRREVAKTTSGQIALLKKIKEKEKEEQSNQAPSEDQE